MRPRLMTRVPSCAYVTSTVHVIASLAHEDSILANG